MVQQVWSRQQTCPHSLSVTTPYHDKTQKYRLSEKKRHAMPSQSTRWEFVRVCVTMIKLIERENMSDWRPVHRDGTTTLIQANKHALILSLSLHRTTTKLKSVRSHEKKRHATPSLLTMCECVHASPFTSIPTSAGSIQMVQLLWSRQTNLPSVLSPSTLHHHKTQKVSALRGKKDMSLYLRSQDASACIRCWDWIDQLTKRNCGWLAPDRRSALGHVNVLLVRACWDLLTLEI